MDVHRLHRRLDRYSRRDPRRLHGAAIAPGLTSNDLRLRRILHLPPRLRPHEHNPLRHPDSHLQQRIDKIQRPRPPGPQHLRLHLAKHGLLPSRRPLLALQLLLLQRPQRPDQGL